VDITADRETLARMSFQRFFRSYPVLAGMTGTAADAKVEMETVYRRKFTTRAEARTALFDYIESFYNRTRLHSSLGYLSPITFESQLN